MSLTSLSFIGVYFPLLLIAYYNPIIKSNKFRKTILVCASLGLYAFSEPLYIFVLIGIILYNYLLVRISEKTCNKIFRIIAIILNVFVLFTFKYINSFLQIGLVNTSLSSIAFPIGLSYFSFKAISYNVDSIDDNQGDFLDVAIYISNFLTIVSGPLSTYHDELPNIMERKKTKDFDSIYRGIERFILGFAKKVIIADSLGVLVSQCFAMNELSFVMSWAGAIAYTLQLFFDFSGYTDMAIGIGVVFGFDLPENFNYPYMATSISDFWKRWHISLTKWFTRYIYIPLGGSKVTSSLRHIFNLFVVWIITGIWHGSSLTFIIWAMIYFVLQLIEKYTKWSELLQKIHLSHIYTLVIVVIEWVIFRSATVSSGMQYIGAMFLLNKNRFVGNLDISILSEYLIPLTLGIIFSTTIGVRIKNTINSKLTNIIYSVGLILLFIICIIITFGRGYSAPLYAGF